MQVLDLGITGIMMPIGIVEAVQRTPQYLTTCEVSSMNVELIRVKIDTFVNQTKARKEIWSNLSKYADDMQN